MYLIFCFEGNELKIENFRNNSSAEFYHIVKEKKVSNTFRGCAILFYKISCTVKLASLKLRRFGLAEQYKVERCLSTHYIEKCFKQKLFKICFLQQRYWDYMFISPNKSYVLQRFAICSKDLPFPIQCIIFQKLQIFGTPSSYAFGDVFKENLILDNFWLKHFLM